MFWGKHMLHIVLFLLTPARDWRLFLFPKHMGGCAGADPGALAPLQAMSLAYLLVQQFWQSRYLCILIKVCLY